MKLEEILDLDCRERENVEKLQKALRKIPALKKRFSSKELIPLEGIEGLIEALSKKYAIMIQYICPTYIKSNTSMYCVSLKTLDPVEWLGNVYGCTLYEAMAKAALKMYSTTRNNSVKLLSECSAERRRVDEIKNLY